MPWFRMAWLFCGQQPSAASGLESFRCCLFITYLFFPRIMRMGASDINLKCLITIVQDRGGKWVKLIIISRPTIGGREQRRGLKEAVVGGGQVKRNNVGCHNEGSPRTVLKRKKDEVGSSHLPSGAQGYILPLLHRSIQSLHPSCNLPPSTTSYCGRSAAGLLVIGKKNDKSNRQLLNAWWWTEQNYGSSDMWNK